MLASDDVFSSAWHGHELKITPRRSEGGELPPDLEMTSDLHNKWLKDMGFDRFCHHLGLCILAHGMGWLLSSTGC